jgi:hypothetical protein
MRSAAWLVLIASAALAQPQMTELRLDEPRELTWSDGHGLSLLWEVVTDSRCPKEADCIRAGEVEVRLTVVPVGSQGAELVLRLPERDGVGPSASVEGYSIRLEQVTPEASLGMRQEDYRSLLTVASPGTLLPKSVTAATAIVAEGWARLKVRLMTEAPESSIR